MILARNTLCLDVRLVSMSSPHVVAMGVIVVQFAARPRVCGPSQDSIVRSTRKKVGEGLDHHVHGFISCEQAQVLFHMEALKSIMCICIMCVFFVLM